MPPSVRMTDGLPGNRVPTGGTLTLRDEAEPQAIARHVVPSNLPPREPVPKFEPLTVALTEPVTGRLVVPAGREEVSETS